MNRSEPVEGNDIKALDVFNGDVTYDTDVYPLEWKIEAYEDCLERKENEIAFLRDQLKVQPRQLEINSKESVLSDPNAAREVYCDVSP